MPAVIDTRRPRVLHCDPDCPSLISSDCNNDVRYTKFPECNHGQVRPHGFFREAWREHKNRKRISRHFRITMDMQAIITMENFCNVAEEVKVSLVRHVTHLHPTKFIHNGCDVADPKAQRDMFENGLHIRLEPHRSALHRLPNSSAESSQCSCPSRTKRSNESETEEQRHKVDSDWFVGRSDRSFIKCQFKTDSNKIQRWEKGTIDHSKKQSYFQFVLLLFLFAFGHSSVTRSSVSGLVTLGTIFCAPTWAAPINSLEATNRSERSANLSHVSGTSRWIQMFIRNRYLQILPDGTVNGTDNDNSIYTILQRITVATAQLQIKASATCLYLCMDSCGLLYGSSNVTQNCIFKENILTNGYNYYSSVSGSGPHKNLLIALNRFGQSRKLKVHNSNFGKRINYARALTMTAPVKQMAALRTYIEGKLQNPDKIRHARNVRHEFSLQQKFCSTISGVKENIRENPKCNKKQEKRRKKKRAPSGCKGSEWRSNSCGTLSGSSGTTGNTGGSFTSKRSCEHAGSDILCKKQLQTASSKKRKSRIKVSKGDEKSQPRRKDITQKIVKKSMPAGALKDSKKSQVMMKQQKRPVQKQTSRDLRKKLTEKTMRTSLPPPWENSSATLPTWYTLSTNPSTWDNFRTPKPLINPKNAVTTATKPVVINKLQLHTEINVEFNSSLLLSSFEVSEDPVSSVMSSDLSIEDSEEGIYSEDNESTSSVDYVTLMTTMDTTPPARTEDYTKATTQSTINKVLDVKSSQYTNSSNHTTTSASDVSH